MDHQNETENSAKNTTILSSASHLTRPELMKRRFNNLKRLSKCYRGLYWVLIEHLRTLYAQYLRDTGGLSPFNDHNSTSHCAFLGGCHSNAMPLTTFCHLHILSDPNQKLYKPCNFLIQSAQGGPPIECGKPILRSTDPSLCTDHFRTGRTGILNVPPTPPLPNFDVILTEFVRRVQMKRRKEILKGNNQTCGCRLTATQQRK